MYKGFIIWVLYLILPVQAWSQQDTDENNAAAVSSVGSKDISSLAGVGGSNELLVEVLFATNEDCDLFIDDESKGLLSKNQFRYLKLPAGPHSYRAKSKTTFDELKDSFIVAAGKPNEIFIDLLYTLDEKAAERERLKKASNVQPVVLATRPGNNQPEIKKLANSKEDVEKEVITSLIGNMVPIKGGSFVMGNNRSPLKDEVEHPVAINSIYFSKYEVTQHQWETIMGYNPSFNRNCATCPVDNVSWEEVIRFIRKLNNLSTKKFRLPTEAEWEFVAKIGGKVEVDTAGGQEAYIQKTAWFFGNAGRQTQPVGLRQPNVAGVFDLMGNVSEWCSDWYSPIYSKEDFNQLNPEGPPLGKQKVIRGGNYKDYVGDRFRPSLRTKRIPTEKGSELGFRLVMDYE